MGTAHGTTILWVRRSPRDIIIGEDSRSTQFWMADEPKKTKRLKYNTLVSDDVPKAFTIFGSIIATLSGDPTRFGRMVHFVESQLRQQMKSLSLLQIGSLATTFLRVNPPTEMESVCEIYMCSWIKQTHSYEVIFLRDGFNKPILVKDNVFGSGSGSPPRLACLKIRGASNDVDAVLTQMLIASGKDPSTGGPIKVHSLRDNFTQTVRIDSLAHRLHRHDMMFVNMLFGKKSMFVIISKNDEHKLSPHDLKIHLEGSFDPAICERDIDWLCVSDSKGFQLFLVHLSCVESSTKWLLSCKELHGFSPVRKGRFLNKGGGSCDFCLARATCEVLDKFKTMKSFDDLF